MEWSETEQKRMEQDRIEQKRTVQERIEQNRVEWNRIEVERIQSRSSYIILILEKCFASFNMKNSISSRTSLAPFNRGNNQLLEFGS
jgi:hypothetical protein